MAISPIPSSTMSSSLAPPMTVRTVSVQNRTDLGQLLLDEEGPQMRELPCAGSGENDDLDKHPSDGTGVGSLGLVSEFGLTFLFPVMLAFKFGI